VRLPRKPHIVDIAERPHVVSEAAAEEERMRERTMAKV
jgi:hypothetical protein